MKSEYTFKLSKNETLVLFSFLSDLLEEKRHSINYTNDSEEIVLNSILCQLEKVLVEPFKPDYFEALDKARSQIGKWDK
jgi:hypothetical protein